MWKIVIIIIIINHLHTSVSFNQSVFLSLPLLRKLRVLRTQPIIKWLLLKVNRLYGYCFLNDIFVCTFCVKYFLLLSTGCWCMVEIIRDLFCYVVVIIMWIFPPVAHFDHSHWMLHLWTFLFIDVKDWKLEKSVVLNFAAKC